jgi:hypothetical protein
VRRHTSRNPASPLKRRGAVELASTRTRGVIPHPSSLIAHPSSLVLPHF